MSTYASLQIFSKSVTRKVLSEETISIVIQHIAGNQDWEIFQIPFQLYVFWYNNIFQNSLGKPFIVVIQIRSYHIIKLISAKCSDTDRHILEWSASTRVLAESTHRVHVVRVGALEGALVEDAIGPADLHRAAAARRAVLKAVNVLRTTAHIHWATEGDTGWHWWNSVTHAVSHWRPKHKHRQRPRKDKTNRHSVKINESKC